MVEISVIVPVYNAAAYLRDALKTYLNQTFRNIEIIIINDGSTDGSLEIIREFERLDSRIVVVDGENRGVDAARNTGLEMAQGKYISFLDADDIAEETMLKKLYSKIEEEGSDLVVCGYKTILINGEIKEHVIGAKETISIEDKPGRIKLINSYIPGNGADSYALWNKLFRKDIIKKNTIEFKSHKYLYFDDTAFCYEYLLYVDTICFVEDMLYTYIKRPSSITTSYVKDSRLRFYNYCKYLQENFQKHDLLDECRGSLAIIAFDLIIRLIRSEFYNSKLFFENYKNLKEIVSDENFRKIVQNITVSRLPYKRKVIYFLYKFRLYFIAFISFKVFLIVKD